MCIVRLSSVWFAVQRIALDSFNLAEYKYDFFGISDLLSFKGAGKMRPA